MLHIGTTASYGNQAPYNVTLPTIRVRTTGTLDSLPLFYLHSSIYEQRKEGMNHLTSSGQEARATFQNRVLKIYSIALGQWKKALRMKETQTASVCDFLNIHSIKCGGPGTTSTLETG
ncbi:hypothetical protein ACJX0J_000403 (mitochondrion) [Zea mays]